MVPTLQVRDVLLVDEIAYRLAPAQRRRRRGVYAACSVGRQRFRQAGDRRARRRDLDPRRRRLSQWCRAARAVRESSSRTTIWRFATTQSTSTARRSTARAPTSRRARCGKRRTAFPRLLLPARRQSQLLRRFARLGIRAGAGISSGRRASPSSGRCSACAPWRDRPLMTPYELLAIVAVIGARPGRAFAAAGRRRLVGAQYRDRPRVSRSLHHRGPRRVAAHHVRRAHVLHSLGIDAADPADPRRAAGR